MEYVKSIVLLHPIIFNEAKGGGGYGMQARCFFPSSMSVRVITNLSSSKQRVTEQDLILAVQSIGLYITLLLLWINQSESFLDDNSQCPPPPTLLKVNML